MNTSMLPIIMYAFLAGILHANIPKSNVSEQAYELAKELRCVVCQNQSVAESDAGIAQDMRRFIQVELDEGKTKQEIFNQLVDTYGEFIIFTPTMTSKNLPLWFIPMGVFLILVVQIRKSDTRVP